ncbi:MAG: GIY-YIG nuclease family protein [Candidatus Omnitrophica bacterium]|nr:GIY-YIG nuclease family protein [Candidatus Omnitrophota bacterium]
MWYLYILRCKDGYLYTGVTTDIPRRAIRHNSKKASTYIRIRTPVKLAYKETHHTKSKALIREAQIKRWSKQKKIALINHNSSQLIALSKSRD